MGVLVSGVGSQADYLGGLAPTVDTLVGGAGTRVGATLGRHHSCPRHPIGCHETEATLEGCWAGQDLWGTLGQRKWC